MEPKTVQTDFQIFFRFSLNEEKQAIDFLVCCRSSSLQVVLVVPGFQPYRTLQVRYVPTVVLYMYTGRGINRASTLDIYNPNFVLSIRTRIVRFQSNNNNGIIKY